jgi:tetratricopeptide (TPR) repeat protein
MAHMTRPAPVAVALCAALLWFASAAPAAQRGRPDKGDCCPGDTAEIARLIEASDRLYSQFKPREAAAELRKVLEAEPNHFQALVKLARAHIDIGDSVSRSSRDWQQQRIAEYRRAERYARQAIEVDPDSTWGHFYLSAALGSVAVLSPPAEQVELAGEVRAAVEKAIALDPDNGFAYHVYGVWHRKMAEIGRASRVVASVLYGKTVPAGSLEKSIEYLTRAVDLNPRVITSRLELARSYIAVEDWSRARGMLTSIRDLPIRFSDDAQHKRTAEDLIKEIDGR